jgi:hypothetical protein
MKKDNDFDITVTKKGLKIKKLVIEDPDVGKYFFQFKADKEILKKEVHLAFKLGTMALSDNRLSTELLKLESEFNTKLSSIKDLLLEHESLSGQEEGKILEKTTLLNELQKITHIFDDTVIPTGDIEGVSVGRKVGDFIVTLNPKDTGNAEKRIAIESKSASGYTIPKLQKELDEARINRNAETTIMVFEKKKAPASVGALRHLPNYGFACVFDSQSMDNTSLEVAYKLARYEVLGKIQKEEIAVDSSKLKDLIKKSIGICTNLQNIRSNITKAQNNLEGIKSNIETYEKELIETFEEMESCFTAK